MNLIDICKKILLSIQAFIQSDECLQNYRSGNHFTRKRLLSLEKVVLYLLFSSKASMYQNIASIVDELGENIFPEVTKQAISKARQGIKPSLFKNLFELVTKMYYTSSSNRKTWHNYNIYAVDGTRIQLPNSESNFDEFGLNCGHQNPNRKWSLALGSAIYDVMNDFIIDASINHYAESERTAARLHLRTIKSLNITKNSIVIFDRGYYSEDFYRYCLEHNQLCLFRIKEGLKLAKNCTGDTMLKLKSKYYDSEVEIRVLEIDLGNGTTEFLATNIYDTSLTRQDFKELYFLRWPIEQKYLELKDKINLEDFNGATSISIQQEFYINLLISNISAMIKASADEVIETETKNSSRKTKYQANRTFIIGRVRKYLGKIVFGLVDISIVDKIFERACKNRSQVQPNRKYKRPRIERKRTKFRNRKPTI